MASAQARSDGSSVQAYRVPSPRRHMLWPSLCGVGGRVLRAALRFSTKVASNTVSNRPASDRPTPRISQIPVVLRRRGTQLRQRRPANLRAIARANQSDLPRRGEPSDAPQHACDQSFDAPARDLNSRRSHAVASRRAIDMAEQHPAPLPPALRSAARPRNAYAAHASATRIGARLSRNWRALASQVKREA